MANRTQDRASCRQVPADSIAVGLMVPYPGTEVWHMAQEGRYGYKLLSEDWRLSDKYFGNALSVEGLSHRQLQFLQSLTYVWYYVYNLRFRDLLRFVLRFRTEAWTILRRLLQPAKVEAATVQFQKARTLPAQVIRKAS